MNLSSATTRRHVRLVSATTRAVSDDGVERQLHALDAAIHQLSRGIDCELLSPHGTISITLGLLDSAALHLELLARRDVYRCDSRRTA